MVERGQGSGYGHGVAAVLVRVTLTDATTRAWLLRLHLPSTSRSATSMAEPAPVPRAASAPVKLSDSMCAPQYAASLKCLDEANYDKSKCQDYFDAYKECKKQERELRLEANRKSKRFF